MTAALWLLTCLPLVLPAVSKLPPPVNLNLTSKHFRTVLKWEAGARTPTGASYQVTVNTDRGTPGTWVLVSGCEQVQIPLVCNLTEVFSDPSHSYLAQVMTRLGEEESEPTSYSGFKLIRDSQLDLPLLHVTLCDLSLCVDLQFPKLYMLNMSQHHRDIYNSSLIYKLKVNGAEIPQEIKYLQKHIVKPSFSATEYCVSICFWHRLESKESEYSPPVCASTPAILSADVWISLVLCALVTFVVIGVVFRFAPRCICPLKRPLPLVLKSVHHIDVPIITSSSISLPSVLTVVMTKLPSSGERGHKLSSSDESDGESETESAGGDDQPREGAKLMSSSLSPPLYQPDPQSLPSSAQISNSSETCSSSAVTHRLSTNTDGGTMGSAEPDQEEKEVVAVADGQDVNLLTLTFGRHHVEEEEDVDVTAVERMTPSASEERSITSVQTSHPGDSRGAGTQIMTCSAEEEDEEEEDEDSEYMGRPCTSVLQGFLQPKNKEVEHTLKPCL